MTTTDLDERIRETLHRHADDIDPSPDLWLSLSEPTTDVVAFDQRRRGTRRWVPAVAAASVIAVAGIAVAITASGSSQRVELPAPAAESTTPPTLIAPDSPEQQQWQHSFETTRNYTYDFSQAKTPELRALGTLRVVDGTADVGDVHFRIVTSSTTLDREISEAEQRDLPVEDRVSGPPLKGLMYVEYSVAGGPLQHAAILTRTVGDQLTVLDDVAVSDLGDVGPTTWLESKDGQIKITGGGKTIMLQIDGDDIEPGN